MPTLLEYINQLQREHRYRIKMVFAPSERQLESIERHMKKYDALEVGRPEKLMLQSMPPDFPQYGGHEIVLVDVVTRLPVSPAVLESELRGLLMVPEGTLRAFSHDDPLIQQEETKEPGEYEVKTGADYTDKEANPVKAEDVAGDAYVEKVLKDAAKDDRRKVVLAKETDAKTSGPVLNDKSSSASPLTKTKG
jgi:hypothetical protein